MALILLAAIAPNDIRPVMIRLVAAALVAEVLSGGLPSAALSAQSWNGEPTRALVQRATERRARQLSDSGLVDYSATARGFLTFLAQVGQGFPLPPKIIKADELALEVYWRAPNYSKQWIVGRRDTLLLPTDIQYHRDHLGIVQNNFPDIIRLGDGDEVRDVPHPLSTPGLSAYDFAISDSLRFEIPGRTIDLYEVKVRPRDQSAPAAVGALYIAKGDAQVVRMAFSFTRAALRDKQLEDVSIVLENSLTEGKYWLPRRQEIEIRRTGSWMDFPARGIIRGRWEIRDYRVNQGETVTRTPGPEIVNAPAARRARHVWPSTPLLDSLPMDVRAATDEDVRQVQEEARRLVRAQALARPTGTLPSAQSLSELARVNRAEGVSVGLGLRRRFGAGFDAGLAGRYGLSDHQPKGALTLGWERADGVALRGRVFREYRDAGDEAETSRVRNTIASQEFGSDYTQPFDTRGVAATWHLGAHGGLRWQLEGAYEWHDRVEVAARPSRGRYEPTIDAVRGDGPRVSLRADRASAPFAGDAELRLHGELRLGSIRPRGGKSNPGSPIDESGGSLSFARIYASAELQRAIGRGRLVARVGGGALGGNGNALPQQLLYAGGPSSGPGYEFHQFRGLALATQHLEWRSNIPFVRIPLGRWGSVPGQATLAPFVHGVYISPAPGSESAPKGWYPSVGFGVLTIFDLLRVDIARGLRSGRWTFGVDVSRDFWPIL